MNNLFKTYLTNCNDSKVNLEAAKERYFSLVYKRSVLSSDLVAVKDDFESARHEYVLNCEILHDFISEHADQIRFE